MNLHDTLQHPEQESSYTTVGQDDRKDSQEIESISIQNIGTCYDVEHEEHLKQSILHIVFNFDAKNWSNGNVKDNNKDIQSHYRFINSTSYQLRASMPFEQHHDNIMDYYSYLESGYNDDDLSWINNKSENKLIKILDINHQLMYNKGDGGLLNYIISPRDTCYMRTRFKSIYFQFKQQKYDIVGSLDYSVSKDHLFYYPDDPKCVRVDMKYRGFILIHNIELQQTKLVYTSYFDIKGNIPKWITESGIKNLASNFVLHFNEDWMNKIKRLKNRRKQKEMNKFKSWIIDIVGLPQYIDNFLENGFDDLSYLTVGLNENDLKDIGIKLKGHRMKILSEIKKLEILTN